MAGSLSRHSLALLLALALAAPSARAEPAQTQGAVVLSHAISVSDREASLEFELADRSRLVVALRASRAWVNGEAVGRYRPGGALERSFRRLLAEAASLDTPGLLVAVRNWTARDLAGEEADTKRRLDRALRRIAAAPAAGAEQPAGAPGPTGAPGAAPDTGEGLELAGPAHDTAGRGGITLADLAALEALEEELGTVGGGRDLAAMLRRSKMRLGGYEVPAGAVHRGDLVVLKGDADIRGHVTGDVLVLYGDLISREGSRIDGDAMAVAGNVMDEGGTVRGDIRTISIPGGSSARPPRAARAARNEVVSAWRDVTRGVFSVLAVFVSLAMIGLGVVFVGRRYLEVVADTARHAFGRSLAAGLLGQLLLVPTFAMLIVGLVFTVVGILLLPFAILAYLVAAAAALLGGYLAVAHSVGETYARRRMAHGAYVRSPNAYGYLFTGLAGLLGLWAAAALFAWAGPVVVLLKIAAVVVTWAAVTVGFGAVLLSRAGLRETFAGRYAADISDEYLWATPPATASPAPKEPGT